MLPHLRPATLPGIVAPGLLSQTAQEGHWWVWSAKCLKSIACTAQHQAYSDLQLAIPNDGPFEHRSVRKWAIDGCGQLEV